MNNQSTQTLSEQYLQAEHDVLSQVLTAYLGKKPGKVEEFLIEKIQPFKHNFDYALHFDGFLLGYIKFGMDVVGPFVTFEPEIIDERITSVRENVNQGLVSNVESYRRIKSSIDHWSEVDSAE